MHKIKNWNTIYRVPTLPGKPGILLFSFQGLENAWNLLKSGILTQNLEKKTLKLANSMFQASLFKMSFTNIILIDFFVISTLSTQTLIRSQIDLGFHCFYLENTWNFVSQKKWETCICFNTFQDFYN